MSWGEFVSNVYNNASSWQKPFVVFIVFVILLLFVFLGAWQSGLIEGIVGASPSEEQKTSQCSQFGLHALPANKEDDHRYCAKRGEYVSAVFKGVSSIENEDDKINACVRFLDWHREQNQGELDSNTRHRATACAHAKAALPQELMSHVPVFDVPWAGGGLASVHALSPLQVNKLHNRYSAYAAAKGLTVPPREGCKYSSYSREKAGEACFAHEGYCISPVLAKNLANYLTVQSDKFSFRIPKGVLLSEAGDRVQVKGVEFAYCKDSSLSGYPDGQAPGYECGGKLANYTPYCDVALRFVIEQKSETGN